MKKLISQIGFLCSLMLLLSLSSCTKENKYEKPFLNIESNGKIVDDSNNSFTLSEKQKEITLTIESNREWNFEKIPDWLSVTPQKGVAGKTLVTVKATDSTSKDREAKLSVSSKADQTINININIKQTGKDTPPDDDDANKGKDDDKDKGKISIAELRQLHTDKKELDEKSYIEGEVILNGENKVINSFLLCVSDGTAGIVIKFPTNENIVDDYQLGSKIKISLKNLKFNVFKGLLQLQSKNDNPKKSKGVKRHDDSKNESLKNNITVVEKKSSTPIQPKLITIQDANSGKYESMLVKLENVQFEKGSTTFCPEPKKHGLIQLKDKSGESIIVFTHMNATFKDKTVPKGSGTFIGIGSKFKKNAKAQLKIQLIIRNPSELNMNNQRF